MISIPKCGTNLLLKTVQLITGIETFVWPPVFLEKQWLIKNPYHKIVCHAICVEKNTKLLSNKTNIKKLFIYRDPRDQVVSMANSIKNSDKPYDKEYSFDELILCFITEDRFWQGAWPPNIGGIDQFYNLYLPWQNYEGFYTTTFEKLIGPLGGGDKETQINEIKNIAKHLETEISSQKAEEIACTLFGGTHTFYKGQIGAWKNHFTQKHKEEFKKIAGQLLIDLGYEKDFDW